MPGGPGVPAQRGPARRTGDGGLSRCTGERGHGHPRRRRRRRRLRRQAGSGPTRRTGTSACACSPTPPPSRCRYQVSSAPATAHTAAHHDVGPAGDHDTVLLVDDHHPSGRPDHADRGRPRAHGWRAENGRIALDKADRDHYRTLSSWTCRCPRDGRHRGDPPPSWRQRPQTRIVVLTSFSDPRRVQQAPRRPGPSAMSWRTATRASSPPRPVCCPRTRAAGPRVAGALLPSGPGDLNPGTQPARDRGAAAGRPGAGQQADRPGAGDQRAHGQGTPGAGLSGDRRLSTAPAPRCGRATIFPPWRRRSRRPLRGDSVPVDRGGLRARGGR